MPIFEKKEDVFELIDKFEKSSLSEIDIEIAGNIKLNMKKLAPSTLFATQPAYTGSGVSIYRERQTDITDIVEQKENIKANDGKIITAPLIGTYYSAPSPDSEPFIEIGSKVNKGGVLCIIEAMKVMNEIESEISGEVTDIFVENGQTVEYGQPLFRIK